MPRAIWSGSIAVPDDGPAALFYTAVDVIDPSSGRVRLARPAMARSRARRRVQSARA